MRYTKKDKQAWVNWLSTYGPDKFLNSFLSNVEGAVGRCEYCHQEIAVDVMVGGGVPDWSTKDGDFGCDESPVTTEGACGGHMPVKRRN